MPPFGAQFHTSTPATAYASSVAAVRNAFAEAGLSDKTIDKVLSEYSHYLRWGIDAELNPGRS